MSGTFNMRLRASKAPVSSRGLRSTPVVRRTNAQRLMRLSQVAFGSEEFCRQRVRECFPSRSPLKRAPAVATSA